MTELDILRALKAIHDRRQKIAFAQLQQSKAAVEKVRFSSVNLDQEIVDADAASKAAIRQLMETTKSAEHHRSLPVNLAVEKLGHREVKIWLNHKKLEIQEDLAEAELAFADSKKRCSLASGKQEKFKVLVEAELECVLSREEAAEEDMATEVQSQMKQAADVR